MKAYRQKGHELSQELKKYEILLGEDKIPNLTNATLKKLRDIREYSTERKWALKHKSECLELFKNNFIYYGGFDISRIYGISKWFYLGEIPETLRKPKTDYQLDPMPFTDDFYEKLMACKKIKLCKSDNEIINKKDLIPYKKFGDISEDPDKYTITTSYYIGNVEGQHVLFKEVISTPCHGKIMEKHNCTADYPTIGHYELKALLGPDGNNMVELCRLDFRPGNVHNNRLINHKLSEAELPVYGTHIHFVNTDWNVVAPTAPDHGEVLYIDIPGERVENDDLVEQLSIQHCILAIAKASNIDQSNNNLPFDNSYCKTRVLSKVKVDEEYLEGTFAQRAQAEFNDIYIKRKEIGNVPIKAITNGMYQSENMEMES